MRLIVTVVAAIALACGCAAILSPSPSIRSATPVTTGDDISDQLARDGFRQRAQSLYDAVTADPIHFAGIYSTDEGGRWRIVVRYVGGAPVANVVALVDSDIPVDWVSATYPMTQLNAVFGELRVLLQPEISSRRVSQITPDEASNTVLVGFPQDEPDLQKMLTTKYGAILSFKIVPLFEPIP